MLLHDPSFEAHRHRNQECLEFIAKLARTSVYELLAGATVDEKGSVTMARGRPAKKPSQADNLLAALAFINVAQGEEHYSNFCQFAGNFVVAFNGQIAAGFPVAEDLNCCPHIDRLKIALTKCGKSLALSETEGRQLSVKGEKLRAVVPCDVTARPSFGPDMNLAPADDRLKEAFKVCGTLATEAAADVLCASLLLEANFCTGTNRAVMLQCWHGINLPPGCVLPKAFTAHVAKQTIPIVGFGCTWNEQLGAPSSITLWFENGSWLKTQCYNDRWPSISHLLDVQSFPVEAPAGLFDAIETVAKFNDDATVYFVDNGLQSHEQAEVGAQYDVPGLQGGKAFDGDLISQVGPWAARIDLTTAHDRVFFFGGHEATPVRGVLMAKGPASQP